MEAWQGGVGLHGALQPLQTKQESLQDRAYAAIRLAIITKAIPPGAKVSEASLANTLGVSKTPVREALLRLTGVGLLESDGRSGVRVPPPSLEALQAAFDVREGLEVQSARLAARCAADRGELVAAAEQTATRCLTAAKAGDDEGFRSLDREFHLTLAKVTNNRYLIQAIGDACDLTSSLRLRDAPADFPSVECGEHHLDVMMAVAAGEVDRAAAAMRSHISEVRGKLTSAFRAHEVPLRS